MRKTTKTEILVAWLIIVLSAAGLFAADIPVQQPAKAPEAVAMAVDSNGDAAFAADLKAAEDLLRGLSHERKMTPVQSREYMAQQVERAKLFFDFAKKDLIPHTVSMMKKMQNPDGMIAEGRAMVEKNPASWQGHDYVASGYFRKLKVDEAMKSFEQALEHAPELQKDWYRYMLANCNRMKEGPEQAFALYERIIAANTNWLAVKSSYLGASMMLLGKDMAKASDYFDKGMTLCLPAEREALLQSGVCERFSGMKKGPAACPVTSSMK